MMIIIIKLAFIIWDILNMTLVMVSIHNRDFPSNNYNTKDMNSMNLIYRSSYLITLFIIF